MVGCSALVLLFNAIAVPLQLSYYTCLYCIACNTRSFTEGVGFEQRSDTDTLKRPIRDREQVEVILEEESALACEIAAAELEAEAATAYTPFVVASKTSKTSSNCMSITS